MRLIHTSDWHLGRSLYGTSLLEDQAQVLAQFVEVVRDFRPDLVLILGDLFERSQPGPEVVSLLDQTLARLVQDLKVRTVLVPGLQDNPSRLSFCSWLLDRGGLHVVTGTELVSNPLVLEDADGPVHLFAVPWNHSATGGTAAAQATRSALDGIRKLRRLRRKAVRAVVAAYVQMAGLELTGSERSLYPSAEALPPEAFEGFSYAALGFLHRPLVRGALAYSGAPLKFAFEEAGQQRSLQRVEILRDGSVRMEAVRLNSPRELHRLEGAVEKFLEGPGPGVKAQDFVQLVLSNAPNPIHMETLRRLFPNLLSVERQSLLGSGLDLSASDPARLLSDFYKRVGSEVDDEQTRLLEEILQDQLVPPGPPIARGAPATAPDPTTPGPQVSSS